MAARAPAPPRTPLPAGHPQVALGRFETPVLRPTLRGDRVRALAAAATPAAREAALKELQDQVTARSALASQDSLYRTWCTFHEAWFRDSVDVLPLTADKIEAIGAMFRAGGYRAIDNYLSRMKDAHLAGGYMWDQFLQRAVRRVRRAVTRGIGPARQSAMIDLAAAFIALKCHDGQPLCTGGPVGFRNALVCGAFWMLRELEISSALVRHVSVDAGSQSIEWNLPASKTDVKALGKTRRWGCVCAGGLAEPCPAHAVIDQLRLLTGLFGARFGPGMPLFPTVTGNVADKRHVVESIEVVALRIGESLVDAYGSRRFGGHSLRVTGARTLAALGIDVLLIQLMARWSSDVVLRYVSEAPLAAITDAYRGRARSNMAAPRPAIGAAADLQAALSAVQSAPQADSRLEGYLVEELSLAEAAAGRGAAPPVEGYILNTCSNVVHRPLVWSRSVPPPGWRTECGWPFGATNSSWRAVAVAPRTAQCRTCFRRARAEPSSASSSSSSSSVP